MELRARLKHGAQVERSHDTLADEDGERGEPSEGAVRARGAWLLGRTSGANTARVVSRATIDHGMCEQSTGVEET
jgi:hypothetical protein